MIQLTRLNNQHFLMNCDLIESIEETPDTIITLNNGKKFLVGESSQQIFDKIIAYRQACFRDVLVRCGEGKP